MEEKERLQILGILGVMFAILIIVGLKNCFEEMDARDKRRIAAEKSDKAAEAEHKRAARMREFVEAAKARKRAAEPDFDVVLAAGETSRWVIVGIPADGRNRPAWETDAPATIEFMTTSEPDVVQSRSSEKSVEGNLLRFRFRNESDNPNRIKVWFFMGPPVNIMEFLPQ